MKRIIVLAVATAVPAAGGLLGNQSFASSVPVRSASAPAPATTNVTPVVTTTVTTTPVATTPVATAPVATVNAKHRNDDPAGDNHGRVKHRNDDRAIGATSATIVPMRAKSTTRHTEPGDDSARGRGSENKTDDKGRHGGHDDGPNHT